MSEVKTTCRKCKNTWLGDSKVCPKCGSGNSYSELLPPLPSHIRKQIFDLRIKGDHFHANILERQLRQSLKKSSRIFSMFRKNLSESIKIPLAKTDGSPNSFQTASPEDSGCGLHTEHSTSRKHHKTN